MPDVMRDLLYASYDERTYYMLFMMRETIVPQMIRGFVVI